MLRDLLKASRATHLYFGVFITPAILFFALTGALQTFGLHETNRDHPDYKPARWMVVLGQLHKKQTTIVPVRRPQGAPGANAGPAESGKKHDGPAAQAVVAASAPVPVPVPVPKRHPLPLRIFFLVVCIGLFVSTATGLLMSYQFTRNKMLITITLIAGIIVPLILVFV